MWKCAVLNYVKVAPPMIDIGDNLCASASSSVMYVELICGKMHFFRLKNVVILVFLLAAKVSHV